MFPPRMSLRIKANQPLNGVLQHLRKVAAVQIDRELSDRELLDRFLAARDESAFTVLIERHGPMVLGVCRRSLPNFHDAEDACQATFLVLARKAASVRKKASLSSWLHGVACRVAANLKRAHVRRKAREKEAATQTPRDPAAEVTWREVQTILDEELQRLPDRYRTPIILCHLECMSRDEAAQQLGLSLTTLHGRLEHARGLLRQSLSKRGLTLPAVMSAAVIGESIAQAALTPTLVVASTKAAVLLAAGQTVTEGVVANQVLALTQEVIKSMFLTKLKLGTVAVLCAGLIVAMIGGTLSSLGAQDGKQTRTPKVEERAKAPEKQKQQEDKKPFTAWGKEIGGLQAGVGFRPGEKRAYHHGERVTLVVRVRNVGKNEADFQYLNQFFAERPPTVTDEQGKPLPWEGIEVAGKHIPVVVKLAPGKEIELYEWKVGLLKGPIGIFSPSPIPRSVSPIQLGGVSGKVGIQYERVFGNSSSGTIKVDPTLSTLGTGKLELEIKSDPPGQKQKIADADDEEKAVRAYVEELRAAVKMGGQQVYNVAIRPMFYKSVRWAARKGEDALVVELYQLYTGSPATAVPGGTALTWAAAHNDSQTVKILLDRGLDVNAADAQGRTALHQAIRWGPHNVDLLLQKGAKVNVKTKSGQTPLMVAAESPFPEVVKALLDKKAQVNARDADDRTPLMYAAKGGRLANARALLGHGANVHLKDKAGRTALAQVQAPDLLIDRPGVLPKGAAQELEERAVREEKELRMLLQSAGDKNK
jgi:RNA polymerase sigma factor (sigma-70 family)